MANKASSQRLFVGIIVVRPQGCINRQCPATQKEKRDPDTVVLSSAVGITSLTDRSISSRGLWLLLLLLLSVFLSSKHWQQIRNAGGVVDYQCFGADYPSKSLPEY